MLNYHRVLPRDLFAEAKLLKCLGQLGLLIHDGAFPLSWSVSLECSSPRAGFRIGQAEDDGGHYCENVTLRVGSRRTAVPLRTLMYSRQNYPLVFVRQDRTEERAMDEQGNLTEELWDYVAELAVV